MHTIPYWLDVPLLPTPAAQKIPMWYEKQETILPVREKLNTNFLLYSEKNKKISTQQYIKQAIPREAYKTDIAFLYLHGYSSSPKETSPLIEQLSTLYRANTVCPLLTRHGISIAPLEYIDWKEWYFSALDALNAAQKLGRKVIVISCSTGSTLGLLLSARLTAANEQYMHICLSPNLGLFFHKVLQQLSLHALVQRITYYLSYLKRKQTRFLKTVKKNELHEMHNTYNPPISSLYPMFKLVYLVWYIRKKHSTRFQIPTYVLASKNDHVVDYAHTMKFFKHFPVFAELTPLPEIEYTDSHVLAGDALSPQNTDAFTKKISSIIDSHTPQ